MLELDRTAIGAIVIGASRPEDDVDVANRLSETAKDLRKYLLDSVGFDLPESRLCWLFDDVGAPHEQEEAVASAVRLWANEMGASHRPDNPLNLMIVIVGHAEQGGKHVMLADSKYGERKPKLDVDRLSSRVVSNAPLGSRYFAYLDCCYAGAVFDAMTFRPRGDFALDTAPTPAPDARPVGVSRGVWGLIAANNELRAWAPPGDRLTRTSTLFFEALKVTPRTMLSLDQTCTSMLSELVHREKTIESWRRLPTPRPLLKLKTEESLEQLDKVPLFPSGWGNSIPAFVFPAESRSQFTAVVVTREQGSLKLVDAVKAALDGFGEDLERHVGRPLCGPPVIIRLDTTYAFESVDELGKRLRALCLADLAVFDVTASDKGTFEAGIMTLLGARAVVRRGVTICSVDAALDMVFDYRLPYNLMFVNLSTHDDELVVGRKILQSKISNGFRELGENPSYLDLPAFDAVRDLGSRLEAYQPIPYDEGALYLGPFERAFQQKCFVPLEQALIRALDGLARKRLGRNYTEKHEPRIRRLLDNDASKLVVLSLYEAIRRYDFCLLDWSNLRPNVFFELGARMASSERGAVHIVAEAQPLESELHHIKAMKILFDPMVYPQADFDARREAAQNILVRRTSGAALHRDRHLYREIAAACALPEVHGVDGLVDELSRRADLAYVYDESDRRASAAIYANENIRLKNSVFAKSIGLRLAALFLELGRIPRYEIVRDTLDMLSQQIDQLDQNGGRRSDVQALRDSLGVLRDAARASQKTAIIGVP